MPVSVSLTISSLGCAYFLGKPQISRPAEIGGVVVTQDSLVEGVHFRFDLLSWRELGARAAAVNVSDLAASGADPLGLLVSALGVRAATLDLVRGEHYLQQAEGNRLRIVPVPAERGVIRSLSQVIVFDMQLREIWWPLMPFGICGRPGLELASGPS